MPVFPVCVQTFTFSKSNSICHFSDNLTNLSMSSCNFCLSPISLVFLNSFAYFNSLPVTPSSKSLMYTKNKIGPSTDPCGTPLKTDFQLETFPSTTTLSCLLTVSHWSIQLIILLPIPYFNFNFCVALYQMLSGNPNILHLPMTPHQPT